MTDRRPIDDLVDDRLRNDLLSGQKAAPLPPQQVVVEDTSDGVRVTVVNDGPLGPRLNGAVRYDVYWALDVDTLTAAGKAAGFARAICVGSIPATNVNQTQSSNIFTDKKYQAGFWYVCGVGSENERSGPSEPAQVTKGAVDTTVPGDVVHLQISESGRVANGTVFSELSVTASPPADTSNFGGVQLYLKDYTALGEIQEGFTHPWTGSGAVDFDVLYDIPRRGGKFAIAAINGSNVINAAGGLLSVAQAGDQLELLGQRITITSVADTGMFLASVWPMASISTSDWSIIALVTIYGVSVGKSGSRRADVTGAPSIAVLMDGNISTPNAPANIYLTNSGVSVIIEWDQVAGSTINGYSVYRSAGATPDSGMASSPPRPATTTRLIDRVTQNANLPTGSTYVRMQSTDDKFTLYDLDVNSAFVWYVTTTNTRGDESAATSLGGNCQKQVTGEIDPTQTGRNPGKNYLYNAPIAGTVANAILANDTSQDTFMGTDASNLPGKPYGSASGQANGTGRFRGYTRWEANDAATGAAGSVKFQNGDEAWVLAPGAAKEWDLYAEIGGWNEDGGAPFQKLGKGEVYTLSAYLNHDGATAIDGQLFFYLEQSSNGTVQGNAKRRFRDSTSVITESSTPLTITTSAITATSTRIQAQFQLDSTLTTKQVRARFRWLGGTTGTLVIRRTMVNSGEAAAQWTADMGDPSISIPTPTNPVDPIGDGHTRRDGDGYFDKLPP